jgi:hypothetical protein
VRLPDEIKIKAIKYKSVRHHSCADIVGHIFSTPGGLRSFSTGCAKGSDDQVGQGIFNQVKKSLYITNMEAPKYF